MRYATLEISSCKSQKELMFEKHTAEMRILSSVVPSAFNFYTIARKILLHQQKSRFLISFKYEVLVIIRK